MVQPRRLKWPLAPWTTPLLIVMLALAPIDVASAEVVVVNCTTPQPIDTILASNTTYLLENCSASMLLQSNVDPTVGLSSIAVVVRGGTSLPIIQINIAVAVAVRNFSLTIDGVVVTTEHATTSPLSVVGYVGGELRDSSIAVTNCNIIVREPSAVRIAGRNRFPLFWLFLTGVQNVSIEMENSSISTTQTFGITDINVFAFLSDSIDSIKIRMSRSSTYFVGCRSDCTTVLITSREGFQSSLWSNIDVDISHFSSVVNGPSSNVSGSVLAFSSYAKYNAVLSGTSNVSVRNSDFSMLTTVGGCFLIIDKVQSLAGGIFVVDMENVTANIVFLSCGLSDTFSAAVLNLGLRLSLESLRVNAANVTLTTVMMCGHPPSLTFLIDFDRCPYNFECYHFGESIVATIYTQHINARRDIVFQLVLSSYLRFSHRHVSRGRQCKQCTCNSRRHHAHIVA